MRAMKKPLPKKGSSSKKAPAVKSAARKSAATAKGRASAAKKRAKGPATRAKSSTTNGKSAARTPPARTMAARRADFGAPIDGFFAKQPRQLRDILLALRKIVEEVAPEATASIKWGMPFYSVGTTMMCELGGHKSHVNLILAGPPGTFADPEGRLEGDGKTGRRLTLRSLDELPRDAVRRWVRTALEVAQAKA